MEGNAPQIHITNEETPEIKISENGRPSTAVICARPTKSDYKVVNSKAVDEVKDQFNPPSSKNEPEQKEPTYIEKLNAISQTGRKLANWYGSDEEIDQNLLRDIDNAYKNMSLVNQVWTNLQDTVKEAFEFYNDKIKINENDKKGKKKHSLRNALGLPISLGAMFNTGIDTAMDSGLEGTAMDEIYNYAKKIHQKIGQRYGVTMELYDIEADVNDLDENFNPNSYIVYVKEVKTGKIKKAKFVSDKKEEPQVESQTKVQPQAKEKTEVKKPKDLKRKRYSTAHKSNGRYWTNSHWRKNSLNNIISEIVNPKKVNISSIQLHDELCPKLWDNEVLKPEIRKLLLKNAAMFIQSLGVEKFKAKDIILTGSLANYNYTEQSDIDVHILTDFNAYGIDPNILRELFMAKKSDWNDKGIEIHGHQVEVFVQDINEPNTISSIYSLYYDQWIEKPVKGLIELDKDTIEMKASNLMNEIDKLEDETEGTQEILDKIEKIRAKIRKMRTAGLQRDGEYSIENLTFKVLRNTGYLDKIKEIKNKLIKSELSL